MSFVKYTVESDIGRRRSTNEDRAAFFERSKELKLAIVADGMGGHNAGDIASEMAIVDLEKFFREADVAVFNTVESSKEWLRAVVSELNYKMYHYSLKNEGCQGMGTTLIACLINQDQLLISHVGDSRLYYFTNEEIRLVTRDHSYVNMLVDLGKINEEEAKNHPRKNAIVKAVGTETSIEPDFFEIQIGEASYVLICSDGLSNKLAEGEIAAVLALSMPLADKGKKLVQLANECGGEDNISLVLMSYDEAEVE